MATEPQCDHELPIIDWSLTTPDLLRVDVTDLNERTTLSFETDGKDWWQIKPDGERVKAEHPEKINEALGRPPNQPPPQRKPTAS